MSHVKNLSIYDHRGRETYFKGLFATCPKYMKQLRSFGSEIRIQSSEGFLDNSDVKVLKKMLFPNDFLRFLPKFEEIKAIFPFYIYIPQMDRMLQFKRFPVSTRKISLRHPNCRPAVLNAVSMEHLKGLREFEILLMSETSYGLAKSAYNLISKVPRELQVLSVNFDKEFYIEAKINDTIKKLVNLKNIKLQFSTERFADNLQILENLKECPLESLNLELHFRTDQDISRVKELISKKKNTLKKLKLAFRKRKGDIESVFCLTELIKSIEGLPQLTNFYLGLRFPKPELASAFNFKNLFTKKIPLKKFQLVASQLKLPKTEFLNLLSSLQRISPSLEKLQINVGKFQSEDQTESNQLCEFIRSLVNIRVFKFNDLSISQQDFSGFVKAVLSLRNLTELSIGQFFEIPMRILVSGIEKISGKYGVRKFGTRIMNSRAQSSQKYSPINLINIKRKNPYISVYPSSVFSAPGLNEEIW